MRRVVAAAAVMAALPILSMAMTACRSSPAATTRPPLSDPRLDQATPDDAAEAVAPRTTERIGQAEADQAGPAVAFNDGSSTPPMPGPGQDGQSSTPGDPATAPTVEEPVAAPAAARPEDVFDLKALAVQFTRELYAEAAYADMPMPELLTIASLSIAMPDRPFNAEAFPDLTDRERELLEAFHGFCSELGRELRESQDPEALSSVVDSFRQSIVDEPELLIPRAELCTRVDGYGKFETFNKNSFMARSQQALVVYAEIDRHHAELNDLNEWVTRLTMQVEIWSDAAAIPVWHTQGETIVERSRNRIQDFFLAQIIRIPDALNVGAYTLKIRVTDEGTGAVAERGVPFTLVADRSLAAK